MRSTLTWRSVTTCVVTIVLSVSLALPDIPTSPNTRDSTGVAGNWDLVIYGGTPSGVAAAIAADGTLNRILLISDRPTVGGSISNGLGAVDIGARFAVTGIARNFFANVARHYGDRTMWRTEPHVAESIFRYMLRGTQVAVATNRKLTGASLYEGKIDCITLDYRQEVCAQMFIDASYPGDLIHLSKAKNILGPKDLYQYAEKEAERRHFAVIADFKHFPEADVHEAFKSFPYMSQSQLLPDIKSHLDQASPSWTYRLCLTRENKRPFEAGPDYHRYLNAWRMLIKAQHAKGLCKLTCGKKSNGSMHTLLWQMVRLPNGKFDLNAGTAQLSNFPINLDYFERAGSRAGEELALRNYLESFLYFAQNDPDVPAYERDALKGFGLCADEFVDNNNWPYAPYVREGRRLAGLTTLTTKNIMLRRVSPESVAVGSYLLDTKSSLIIFSQGKLYRDVGSFLKAPVYEIPFSTMLPIEGPTNLLSSVNISTSPTAYGSVRVEAQYMQLGQAAGTAAALSITTGTPLRGLSMKALRKRLRIGGQVTSITQLCKKLNVEARSRHAFDPDTCQPGHFRQETPYDKLYGKITP